MPSKSPISVLLDIRDNIVLAIEFVDGFTFDQFVEDRKTVYAVIRCLEIVSEASRRLPDDLKARHSHIPWSDIAGAGNVYRHDYEDVQERILWRTVREELSDLRAAVENELSAILPPK